MEVVNQLETENELMSASICVLLGIIDVIGASVVGSVLYIVMHTAGLI